MPFDFPILYFIQEYIASPILTPIMIFASASGEGGVIWFAVAIPMLFFKKTRKLAILIICAITLAFVTGELITKNIVCRVRPCYQDPTVLLPIKKPVGYSFPSSHTSTSFAAATVIFIRYKKPGIIALMYAGVISFSRMYLFVHFPSDVIVGVLWGIGSAIVTLVVYKRLFSDEIRKCSS